MQMKVTTGADVSWWWQPRGKFGIPSVERGREPERTTRYDDQERAWCKGGADRCRASKIASQTHGWKKGNHLLAQAGLIALIDSIISYFFPKTLKGGRSRW